ncbi:phosphoenolpyruvate synthase/pyruvate phosphate dikinase, partial [Kitasatospora paracochleata]|nr:phosphoenolpyruvate synthase/pyruvate phosphate dikinase [Kitasatospora paracochleata]
MSIKQTSSGIRSRSSRQTVTPSPSGSRTSRTAACGRVEQEDQDGRSDSRGMLGRRGASRYYDERYREGFALECRALRRVRDDMGLTNLVVMIPFCRTPQEADRVLAVMSENGLTRGHRGLHVYVMAEIPANILLAEQFAERFDGFSIGSNDLTQLTLGVDRDSELLAHLFDEHNPAVTRSIESLIATAHAAGRHVGLCG